MTSEQIAINILMCAVKYRQKQVIEIFGSELEKPLFHILAELYKNHPDKEHFVFTVVNLIKGKYLTEDSRFQIDPDLSLSDILAYINATDQSGIDRFFRQYTEDQMLAVLADFVAILKAKMDKDEDLMKPILKRIEIRQKEQ